MDFDGELVFEHARLAKGVGFTSASLGGGELAERRRRVRIPLARFYPLAPTRTAVLSRAGARVSRELAMGQSG